MTTTHPWWRGGVIYQIYPRSFLDVHGDGIGDLEGIRRRLDYVADLGVDAVWISPFFKSPMKDFGYDVSDYTAVDPMFGTLSDFDGVVAAARERGIAVVLVTHNPHHAFLVGDHFTILKLGHQELDAPRSQVTLKELTHQMAGGGELEALSHELRR